MALHKLRGKLASGSPSPLTTPPMAHSCTLKELATVKRLHVAEELLYTRFPVVFSKTPPDVEITVFNDVYHSHSALLRNASPFFEESLSDRWWTPENTHDGHDGIRYKYRLSINIHFLRSSMLEPVPAGEVSRIVPKIWLQDII